MGSYGAAELKKGVEGTILDYRVSKKYMIDKR